MVAREERVLVGENMAKYNRRCWKVGHGIYSTGVKGRFWGGAIDSVGRETVSILEVGSSLGGQRTPSRGCEGVRRAGRDAVKRIEASAMGD